MNRLNGTDLCISQRNKNIDPMRIVHKGGRVESLKSKAFWDAKDGAWGVDGPPWGKLQKDDQK